MTKQVFSFCLTLLALLSVKFLIAQDQKAFYEIIKEDSVVLYFNKDFSFTDRECYDYVRYTLITESGDFNGYFQDRSIEGLVIGTGTYLNGIKDGYFELYYQSGMLYCIGNYENNRPTGIWRYFYESGIPERIINITDSAVFLIEQMDYTGSVKVQNGTGKFEGIVSGEKMPVFVTGKVVDGLPDGKWFIPGMNGTSLYTEKFERRKLVKSSLVSKRKMRTGLITPRLNRLYLGNYLTLLEQFNYQNCDEARRYYIHASAIDAKIFSFQLRQRIDNRIRTDIRFMQSDYYTIGDNFMTVQFSIDEKGKAYDVKLATEWGEYFFEIVKNSLNKALFSNRSSTLYFHLKFSYNSSLQYKYSFKFSKRDLKSKQ